MRIAYLINQYPAVSHTFIRREIQALERQGFEIMRVSLRGWDSELVDVDDLNERKRTRYVLAEKKLALLWSLLRILITRPIRFAKALTLAFRTGFRADRPLPVHLAYLMEACHIESWLRKANVQHVHAHFGTNSAEVAMLVHALGGPRWSFTVHGSELLSNPTSSGLIEKIRQCAFVIAISSYGRAQLFRFVERTHWHKVQLIRCGLGIEQYQTKKLCEPTGRRLVCVGRLSAEKGHLVLLEAAAGLAAEGSEFDIVLIGDGPLRGEIESLIRVYSLQDHVRVAGWMSGSQVRDEILSARALVLPSFAEGIPVVIMEAMALRRPIIATWVGGVPELVDPGEHGWLVPPGDSKALADAMRACLDAPPDMLGHMGDFAQNRVRERHDVDTEATKLAKLFLDCRKM